MNSNATDKPASQASIKAFVENSVSANTDRQVDDATFNTGNGVLTLSRSGGLSDVTVDLDGRFALSGSSGETKVPHGGSLQNVGKVHEDRRLARLRGPRSDHWHTRTIRGREYTG